MGAESGLYARMGHLFEALLEALVAHTSSLSLINKPVLNNCLNPVFIDFYLFVQIKPLVGRKIRKICR